MQRKGVGWLKVIIYGMRNSEIESNKGAESEQWAIPLTSETNSRGFILFFYPRLFPTKIDYSAILAISLSYLSS